MTALVPFFFLINIGVLGGAGAVDLETLGADRLRGGGLIGNWNAGEWNRCEVRSREKEPLELWFIDGTLGHGGDEWESRHTIGALNPGGGAFDSCRRR